MVAQRNSIVSMNQLPYVRGVVFTNDSFWLSYCRRNRYCCDNDYQYNNGGMNE